jgi:hypothetical protein
VPAFEPLLEAAAQVVAAELRQHARRGRRLGRDDDLGRPLAVEALVRLTLVVDRLRGLPSKPREQPG